MKAKILLMAVLLTGALKGAAQNDVAIATLQHGDEVSVFKGPSALASAIAAASDEGDNVITLVREPSRQHKSPNPFPFTEPDSRLTIQKEPC